MLYALLALCLAAPPDTAPKVDIPWFDWDEKAVMQMKIDYENPQTAGSCLLAKLRRVPQIPQKSLTLKGVIIEGKTYWQITAATPFGASGSDPICDYAQGVAIFYRGDMEVTDQMKADWAQSCRALLSQRPDLAFAAVITGFRMVKNPKVQLPDTPMDIPLHKRIHIKVFVERPEGPGAMMITPWGACAFFKQCGEEKE